MKKLDSYKEKSPELLNNLGFTSFFTKAKMTWTFQIYQVTTDVGTSRFIKKRIFNKKETL
jgi:hypothetical protein